MGTYTGFPEHTATEGGPKQESEAPPSQHSVGCKLAIEQFANLPGASIEEATEGYAAVWF